MVLLFCLLCIVCVFRRVDVVRYVQQTPICYSDCGILCYLYFVFCLCPKLGVTIWWRSKKTQPARGWTAEDICTNRVYTIPAPNDGGPIPFFGQTGRRSLPPGWLCSSQKRGTSSQIMARRHIQTNTLQSFGFVTSVTNR